MSSFADSEKKSKFSSKSFSQIDNWSKFWCWHLVGPESKLLECFSRNDRLFNWFVVAVLLFTRSAGDQEVTGSIPDAYNEH